MGVQVGSRLRNGNNGPVGTAQKTGFGLVHPLPGIWSLLHLDTTITLPIGAEAYAAYALRAWAID